MPGMPRGLPSAGQKPLDPGNVVRKSKRRTSWASKEPPPRRKKQNYRPSAPCSFVFPPDSSPSSRGVQAGNADSAQRSRRAGRGFYTSVTSHRPGGGRWSTTPPPAGHHGRPEQPFYANRRTCQSFYLTRDRLRANLQNQSQSIPSWSVTTLTNTRRRESFIGSAERPRCHKNHSLQTFSSQLLI